MDNFSQALHEELILKQIQDSQVSFELRKDFWLRLLKAVKPTNVMEIGVWRGEFAKFLLERVPEIRSFTAVDPWRKLPNWNKPFNVDDSEFEKVFERAKQNLASFKDRVELFRTTSSEAHKLVADQSQDFVYIDGDHTLRGITVDLFFASEKIRPGGIIGGDDLTRSAWQHGVGFSPTMVFPYVVYWAEANGFPIWTLWNRQWLVLADSKIGFTWYDYGNFKELDDLDVLSYPFWKHLFRNSPRELWSRIQHLKNDRRTSP